MPNAARLTDAVDGTTAGEHSGHVPPHSPEPFTGEISGSCSGDVRVNGLAAATVGSETTERDGCCGSSKGAVAARQRNSKDQRKSGGPHRRRPGTTQRERDYHRRQRHRADRRVNNGHWNTGKKDRLYGERRPRFLLFRK